MPKRLSHSFSSTELFACPRMYYELKIAESIKDGSKRKAKSLRGSRLHAEWEVALKHGYDVGDEYNWVLEYVREKFTGLKFAEQKLAIDYSFKPCDWKDPNAFYRAIVDFGCINGTHLDTVDYKTGKFRPKPRQGQEQVLMCMIHMPHIETADARFLWTDADAAPTVTHYHKASQREKLIDDLLEIPRKIEEAREANEWPTRPDDHRCSWCPVLSCKFNTNTGED